MSLLMYTIDFAVMVDPLAHVPVSAAKKAPVMLMGDLLAAWRLRRTGEMSFLEKPARKYSVIDHTSDWAPESVMADTWVELDSECSGATVKMVRGWLLILARRHAPLVNSRCGKATDVAEEE